MTVAHPHRIASRRQTRKRRGRLHLHTPIHRILIRRRPAARYHRYPSPRRIRTHRPHRHTRPQRQRLTHPHRIPPPTPLPLTHPHPPPPTPAHHSPTPHTGLL